LKAYLIATLTTLFSSHLHANIEFTPSELRERSVPECGVKDYNLKTNHPSCGIEAYKSGSGPACGVQSYHRKRDPLCGAEIFKEGSGGACGYDRIEKTRCILKNPLSSKDCIHGETYYENIPKTCRHESFGVELYKDCSRAEFGVASYKSCENPAFGTIYKSCRLAEFGVESYKSCAIRKTISELDVYLASTKPYIQVNALNMLKSHASYLFKAGQQQQTACLIERWSEDPLYEEVFEDMKYTYLSLFGEKYTPGVFDCENTNAESALIFEGKQCLDYDAVQIKQSLESQYISQREQYFFDACFDMHLYESYKNWFKNNLIEIHNLQSDIVALMLPDYKEKLETLRLEIESLDIGIEFYEK
jgi:hypothetical protein